MNEALIRQYTFWENIQNIRNAQKKMSFKKKIKNKLSKS